MCGKCLVAQSLTQRKERESCSLSGRHPAWKVTLGQRKGITGKHRGPLRGSAARPKLETPNACRFFVLESRAGAVPLLVVLRRRPGSAVLTVVSSLPACASTREVFVSDQMMGRMLVAIDWGREGILTFFDFDIGICDIELRRSVNS